MIVILYEDDHKDRAIALADAQTRSKRKTIALPVKTKPKEVPDLTTLIYFGHGTPVWVCTLKPQEMKENIRCWKESNAKLASVELITCNATHTLKGWQPFVDKLKPLLQLGYQVITRNIKIKALPRNSKGIIGAFSVLLEDKRSRTWCYIATSPQASARAQMVRHETAWEVTKIFKVIETDYALLNIKNTITKKAATVGYNYMEAVRQLKSVRDKDEYELDRDYFVLSGDFRDLRSYLVEF
ncbi:hypothetical protein [Pseudoalteromonas denitrificans]|uniref:Uncharacterized protein n=1 Tax=Pseudoalteromonas denitrificans DSM 6059 TaxID=1123010 RepID=A0A1I1TNJ5_9GAMM|nr:hypothetical protein [Pseudoalteromonas denitrificans]SFD60306.1 hypothetical protein SAMN02745724_04950 [Pseudoalteromonas denitrificans DSM 6059]